MAIEKFSLVLQQARRITPNVLHMAFKRADGKRLDYIPGQFITFMFEGADKVKRRSYSIASVPGQDDTIDIAISYVEGGIASEALFNMQPGEDFAAMGPAGRLVIQDDPHTKRYILVATGTGVAPYRTMLPELAKRLTERPDFSIELFLGVQYRQDLLYAQDFREFAKQHQRFRFHAYLSRETTELVDDEGKGYVQHGFESLNLQPDTDIIYLCGNPNMIDDAFALLLEKNFATKAIRREKYISSN